MQVGDRGRRQASKPSVDRLELRASAAAISARDGRLDVGYPRGELALDPLVASRELGGIDRCILLQRSQRLVERRPVERLMAELARIPRLDVEHAPFPHRSPADLIVAQVDVVGFAGDVDESRLLEPPEEIPRREIDAGLPTDRIAAGMQQSAAKYVGI